jgi:transcriptional regulator with XRE-family HTH domain
MPKRKDNIGTVDEVVGRNVRAKRLEARLSQADLGAEIGGWLGTSLPKQVVSKIERGKRRLDVQELLAIAHVLQWPAADLLRPDTDPDIREGDLEVSVGTDNWSPTVAELRELVIGRVGVELEDDLERRVLEALPKMIELTRNARRRSSQ